MTTQKLPSTTTQTSKSQPTTPQFDNFFALFDLPVQFNIDINLLDQHKKALQQHYHPDNLTAEQTTQFTNGENKTSALINHGYQILRQPDSRASYMLEMQKKGVNLDHSIADVDFLENAMSLRIELDEAESITNLHNITETVNTYIDSHMTQFERAFEMARWQEAIAATQKLKFLVKLKKDIAVKLDSLHQPNNDEDDLYV